MSINIDQSRFCPDCEDTRDDCTCPEIVGTCERCGRDVRKGAEVYIVARRATMDSPEECEMVCEECGGSDEL